ncbi:MAG: universal stress protein [Candidatus Scalinduaceae bacterium]
MDSMIRLQKILCSVDFSESSLEALKYATHLALNEGATLYLIHIVDSRIYDYGGPIYEPETSTIAPVIDQTSMDRLKDKLLEEVAKELQDKVETIISFGVPFVEIIKAAKDNDIDLIVMGTHGRSGIAHIMLGSVSEKVVRKAPCPVLTVRQSGHKFVMP